MLTVLWIVRFGFLNVELKLADRIAAHKKSGHSHRADMKEMANLAFGDGDPLCRNAIVATLMALFVTVINNCARYGRDIAVLAMKSDD